ncbi:hypothetical protein [Mycobacterium sp. NPDC050441]|uniref:hypothetical protein n=1 Tax=Mycobacterium sp. NPDC050441 TaxID=3155403 RepID=UPI00340ADAD1
MATMTYLGFGLPMLLFALKPLVGIAVPLLVRAMLVKAGAPLRVLPLRGSSGRLV